MVPQLVSGLAVGLRVDGLGPQVEGADSHLVVGEQELITEFLALNDSACDACGHGLRGVTLSNCPECGRTLRLAVRAQEHTLAPWVSAMLALALAAGFDGILSITIAGAIVYHWNNPPPGFVFVMAGAFAAAGGILLAAIGLIARRRRVWWKENSRRQWSWAAGLALVVFLVHAAAGVWLLMRL